ncbi:MAG TPA: hypothetical protein VI932_00585 [Bacteroidota bacterium]|nr:hypothetical protein [Bacteroidota bacterium]
MKAKISSPGLVLAVGLPFMFAIINLGCQTEYASPLPGIVEVRLKTISSNIDFNPLNNFILTVSAVEAVRDDDARAVVYGDLTAIDREDTKLNTLDVRARDSAVIIGQTYVPPGSYKGIDLLLEPARQAILDGYRIIRVDRQGNFDPRLRFRSQFPIKELATTQIVLEVNLDSTLLRRANTYEFRPFYRISSINEIR